MGFVIGSVLALAVGIFATRVGLDRERTFYATVTIVIASYYVLFAAMGGSSQALLSECVVMIPFVVAAVAGFKREPWLLVLAMAAHGALDMVHPALIANAGVPLWWPDFCCAYDVIAAGYLAVLLVREKRSAVPQAFWTAVAAAHSCMGAADYGEAMRQLERAHVLGQRHVGPHLRVHWLMLQVELCRRSPGAALGQIARLFLGAVGNAVGVLPTGNRGSSAVSMFRKEPIPADLALEDVSTLDAAASPPVACGGGGGVASAVCGQCCSPHGARCQHEHRHQPVNTARYGSARQVQSDTELSPVPFACRSHAGA